MMNLIGKSMVIIHLALSMAALGWALSLYFDLVDWGWKTPRKEVDYIFASEFDKRVVHQKEGYRRRDEHYPAVKYHWPKVREAEKYFVQNNLFYKKELELLVSDPHEIEIKDLKYDKGILQLEFPVLGKPVFQEKQIPEKKKSRESSIAAGKKLYEDIQKVELELREWETKQLSHTEQMKSLRELRDIEVQQQTELRKERLYLEPREVEVRKEAEVYRERRQNLEERLAEIKKLYMK
jgi:hypothetical protein